MLTRIPYLLAILCLVFLVSSCGTEIGKIFNSMSDIRDAAIEISKSDIVSVNIHNASILSVNIVNSHRNDKSSAERKDIAKKIANTALEMYENRDSLDSINVNYGHERKFLIVEIKETIETFQFDPSELINLSPNAPHAAGRSKAAPLMRGVRYQ